MLEIRELTRKYNRVAVVHKVSFTVKPGEILGYLGPNGAGKSTTMKMLAGILEPTSGKILFRGDDIYEENSKLKYKRHVGYIPEQNQVYGHLSAFEYLQLVGRLRLIPDDLLIEKIEGLMEKFHLSFEMHQPMAVFSRGMSQKVLIAAALLHDPDILILDEPLLGLDIGTTLVIRDLISLLAKAGKIIICSSHILEVVEKVCTSVIIINKGHLQAHDSVRKLRELSNQPSLESVFRELVPQENSDSVAHAIHGIMKIHQE